MADDTPTTPADEQPDVWLSTAEAAELTGRHRESIRRNIRNGQLHARPRQGAGRELEVRRSELLDMIQAQAQRRTAAQELARRVASPRDEQSQVLLSTPQLTIET